MLLDIYKECYFNRLFEYKIAEDIKNNKITCPTYLSVGSEFIPVLLKYALQDLNIHKYNIFAQHRCHSYHNTFIQKPLELALELYGHKNGCNKGYGGSASISGENGDIKMWGHDGLLGSNAPIAVGYAQASQELTICVLGDGAVEEDYVLGSFGYAITHKCPILFLVEDNDLSILTKKKERRSWNIFEVAQGFRLDCTNLSRHLIHIEDLMKFIKQDITKVSCNIPRLINIECYRHFWHVGAGQDNKPLYDYLPILAYQLLQKYQTDTGLLDIIIEEQKEKIDNIWTQLEIQLKN